MLEFDTTEFSKAGEFGFHDLTLAGPVAALRSTGSDRSLKVGQALNTAEIGGADLQLLTRLFLLG
jgi:hypothetical protein